MRPDAPPLPRAAARDGRHRVLATDDHTEVLEVIERTLRARFDCEFAAEVVEARRKLEKRRFDLAICDIEMPGESGLVLVEEIGEKWPETAVIVLTSIDDAVLAEQAFELGSNGYLTKPFRPGQLLISSLIALHQRELERAQQNHVRTLESRIQDLMDMAPVPMFIKDRDLRYLVANRVAGEVVGLAQDELMGRTDEEVLPAEAAVVSREVDRRILESGGTFQGEASLRVGGEERTFLSVKFPYVDDDGTVIGVTGIAADITGQKRAEKLERDFAKAQMRAIEELRHSQLETAERLSLAIELHDVETGAHVNRMGRVAALLGRLADLDPEEVELLRAAAPMHDVGKIATPAHILRKTGKLTPEEFEVMKEHTLVGHKILDGSESPLLQMAARIALTHHERFGGGGYPRGLRGEEIPIEGRIVAVADVFDALLSDRPYRPAMMAEAATAIIEAESGTHFDPHLADLLLGHLEEALATRG